MSAEKLTVTVTITVTMTQEAMERWDVNYGTGTKRSELRKDVKSHVGNGVIDDLSANGISGIDVDWK